MSEKQGEVLDRLIKAELDPERMLCPMCSAAFLVAGTVASDRYGVCPTCYQAALANANEERERWLSEYRRNGASRKRIRDARRREPDLPMPPKVNPIFK